MLTGKHLNHGAILDNHYETVGGLFNDFCSVAGI